jgi:hypothetical protein
VYSDYGTRAMPSDETCGSAFCVVGGVSHLTQNRRSTTDLVSHAFLLRLPAALEAAELERSRRREEKMLARQRLRQHLVRNEWPLSENARLQYTVRIKALVVMGLIVVQVSPRSQRFWLASAGKSLVMYPMVP